MIPYHKVAGMVFNTPLLLTADKGDTIGSYVLGRIDQRIGRPEGDSVEFEPIERADGSKEIIAPRISRFVGEYSVDASGRPLPYPVAGNGKVAIISVVGELVNRGAWIGASSGLVSYEGLKHQTIEAGNDAKVKTIVLDITSPGGEAMGAFDYAATIRKVAAKKPVIAFVNGMACSGGYVIASACTKIVTAADAYLGSIGVLWMHLDISQYLASSGVKPTYIYAGARKVDGNPYEALSPEVQARIQGRINKLYDMFVSAVVAGRPKLSAEAVRATEAGIFLGAEAVSLGLADEIGTFEGLIESLAGGGVATTSPTTGGIMAKKQTPPAASVSAAVPKAGPGQCSECTDPVCESFVGEGDNCERETCGHENGSHAAEAPGDAPQTPESTMSPEVLAILEENKRLRAEFAGMSEAKAKLEREQMIASREAEIVAIAAAGHLSGDSLNSAKTFAASLSAEQFEAFKAHCSKLPKIDGSRIATVVQPSGNKVLDIAAAHGVTAEVLRIAAKDATAGSKVHAAVKEIQKTDPKFTVSALRRAVIGK
jgi:capsid assembly protease